MKFYLNAQLFAATRLELEAGVRLAGSDPQRFQAGLQMVKATAQIADAGGMEGICFSEQHANIEGIPEVTTNPILFDAFVAQHTEKLRVGQLGLTLPAHHPMRLAEDLAMLDHMTAGRMFCGFTRGNAPRWVSTLGRPFGTAPTKSDKSEADEANMRAMQEAWQIIKMAWNNETFAYSGEFWQVPAEGIHWGYPVTARFGQGMREDGYLDELGIVPRPLQKPMPQVFTPLAYRLTTSKFWIGEGATAVCYSDDSEFLTMALRVLNETSDEAGRTRKTKTLAPAAMLLIGKDQVEVDALRDDYEWLFATAYSVPPFNVPLSRMLIGTPDQVSEQIENLLEIADFDEMFLWHNIGIHDRALQESSLQLFVDKVLPRFS